MYIQIIAGQEQARTAWIVREDEIEATAMHPFYVIGRGFVPAGELEAGDWLKDSQGRVVEVVEVWIEVLDEPVLVYNLEVEETHTYYVGTGMVLVHNNCYGLGGATPKPGDSDFVGPLPDKGASKPKWWHEGYVDNLSDTQTILGVKDSGKGLSTLGSSTRETLI